MIRKKKRGGGARRRRRNEILFFKGGNEERNGWGSRTTERVEAPFLCVLLLMLESEGSKIEPVEQGTDIVDMRASKTRFHLVLRS